MGQSNETFARGRISLVKTALAMPCISASRQFCNERKGVYCSFKSLEMVWLVVLGVCQGVLTRRNTVRLYLSKVGVTE